MVSAGAELRWFPGLVGALLIGALGGIAYLALSLGDGRLGPSLLVVALAQALLLRGLVRALRARRRRGLVAAAAAWLGVAPVAIGRWAPGPDSAGSADRWLGQGLVLATVAAAVTLAGGPGGWRRRRGTSRAVSALAADIPDWQREAALAEAAEGERWDEVLRLIDEGASPHAYCRSVRRSVLAHAARCRRADVVQRLIAAGARPDAAYDRDRSSPVYQAIAAGDAAILEMLLRTGMGVTGLRDGIGRSPLAAALEAGASREVVQAVLAAVPYSRHSLEEREELLRLARQGPDPSLVDLLVQPVPHGAPTAARQAHERDIHDIELGSTATERVSYIPHFVPDCIHFLPIDGRGRSEVSHSMPPWAALEPRHRAELRRLGGRWFEPFAERLARGEDLSLEELEEAHREATGRHLRCNTIV